MNSNLPVKASIRQKTFLFFPYVDDGHIPVASNLQPLFRWNPEPVIPLATTRLRHCLAQDSPLFHWPSNAPNELVFQLHWTICSSFFLIFCFNISSKNCSGWISQLFQSALHLYIYVD